MQKKKIILFIALLTLSFNYFASTNGIYSFKTKPWYKDAKRLQEKQVLFMPLQTNTYLFVYKTNKFLVAVIDTNIKEINTTNLLSSLTSCAKYFADLNNDGLIDRIVDYIDNDNDSQPDEMDIRYLRNGKLKWAWFWEDIDNDCKMWDVVNFQYGSCWRTDMSGNNIFYANKYDDKNNCWIPIGECPFAFYDYDNDGFSEESLRVSSCPLEFNSEEDFDYANNLAWYYGPVLPKMQNMANVNMRDSFNLDNIHPKGKPYCYRCGIAMEGRVPYKTYPNVYYTNALRMQPNITVRIPWEECRDIANNYPATKTGFTWEEIDRSRQWEGQFWTWERRGIYNAGAIWHRWNMRREYNNNCTTQRWLYYSSIDKKLHLFGASEGWLEVGGFTKNQKIAEIRSFDMDNDGYFDRWEVDIDNDGIADRVTVIPNLQAKASNLIKWDYKVLCNWYTNVIIGTDLIKQKQLLNLLLNVVKQPEIYTTEWAFITSSLAKSKSLQNQRYLTDLCIEYLYHELRHKVTKSTSALRNPMSYGTSRSVLKSTSQAWDIVKWWSKFSEAYGQGNFNEVKKLLNDNPLPKTKK